MGVSGRGIVSGRFVGVMMIARIRMSVIRGLGIAGMLLKGGNYWEEGYERGM